MRSLLAVSLVPLLFVMSGCGHTTHKAETGLLGQDNDFDKERFLIQKLRMDLEALYENSDTEEARKIAEEAIHYSRLLADRYRLIHPPILHNIFVNLGLRERGLCIHWTEDLFEHLRGLEPKTFDLHWGIAYHNNPLLRDHSTVVITARGRGFEEGIVLDPWRHSGDLYWIPVQEDRYPWRSSSSITWQ
jgi:hypothetical protein